MEENKKCTSPIVIGGLGGSGTRLIAQIVQQAGVSIGTNLNESLDNLTYTLLFKRPNWYSNTGKEKIAKRIALFTKIETGQKLTFSERLRVKSLYKKQEVKDEKPNLKSILKPVKTYTNCWGFKEPNTVVALKHLADFYPEMKYILVVRNGLYMAHSGNTNQLKNWGSLFGIEPNNTPEQQLEYWIRANKQAIEVGEKQLGNRFYMLNYDEFCINPSIEIPKLLHFLGLQVSDKLMAEFVKIPDPSRNELKEKDTSIFDEEQLKAVKDLGFKLPKA